MYFEYTSQHLQVVNSVNDLISMHTVKSLFSAPALIYFNPCRTTSAKKREALNFSMANYGVDIVEMDTTHVNKD